MINMKMEIIKRVPEFAKNVANGISFVKNKEVAVGIPEGGGMHEGGISNAALLYIHCNGSEVNNIPPRNVMKAGLEDEGTKKQMSSHIRKGIALALLGRTDSALAQYEQAGMVGAASVQKQFGTIPPPLSPRTVARKGSSATLIDTGALRQAITYAVRDKSSGGGSEGFSAGDGYAVGV